VLTVVAGVSGANSQSCACVELPRQAVEIFPKLSAYENVQGSAGESNACYIKSIFGQTAAGGSAVFIDANSKLGTLTSSKRFKEDIKPMDDVSEALFLLKPVAFRYKKEIDPVAYRSSDLWPKRWKR
jgi:hypothetical protein